MTWAFLTLPGLIRQPLLWRRFGFYVSGMSAAAEQLR
jgi:hypothetical protein